MAFVGRVSQNYFAQISLDYEKKLKQISSDEEGSKTSTTLATRAVSTLSSKEFLNQFASVVVAGIAMIAYAHFSGLWQAVRNIEITYEEIDDEDETDSDEN